MAEDPDAEGPDSEADPEDPEADEPEAEEPAVRFEPDRTMTRADIAAPLVRLSELLDLDCPATATNPFTDVTGPQARSVACLRALSITVGTTATTYSPERAVTRAQLATLAIRLYNVATNPT